jgi:hypothetical protein
VSISLLEERREVMMFFLCLFTITTVIWQEDFTQGPATMSQLYDYTVNISHEEGKVILKADPESENFSAAWFYVDQDLAFTDEDVLELVMKVENNEIRLRYFYRKENEKEYYSGVQIISPDAEYQKIELPLVEARPFFGTEYPASLTPEKQPCLYIFMSSDIRGGFDVEINWISVIRPESYKEEK